MAALLTGRLLDVADRGLPQGHGEVAVDRVHRDPTAHRLLRVHLEAPIVIVPAQIIIHIAGTLGLSEEARDIAGELAPQFGGRPMDLGHHRLQDGRPWGHLHHRDRDPGTRHQSVQPLPRLDRDLVAGPRALVLVGELDLDLGLPGLGAQVVVPDHPVEVEGAGRPGIDLDGRHLGQGPQYARQAIDQVGGHRQGRPLGQVDHHRELRLVVQRHHLHRHPLEIEEGAGEEEGPPQDQPEQSPLPGVFDQGRQDGAEEALDPLGIPVFAPLRRLQVPQRRAQPLRDGQVGGEDEGRKQREEHGH